MAVSVAIAAEIFGTTVGSVQRWIRRGAPTAELGAVGAGNGSLVDIDNLEDWLLRRAGIRESTLRDLRALRQLGAVSATSLDDRALAAAANGLWQAFRRGNRGETAPEWQQLGDKSSRAAIVLAEAFTAIARALTGREPNLEELPEPIQMLHQCAIQALSARTSGSG